MRGKRRYGETNLPFRKSRKRYGDTRRDKQKTEKEDEQRIEGGRIKESC